MKNFRLNLIVRIILLTVSILLFSFVLLKTDLIATLIVIGVAILFQVVSIITFVDKTNKGLARFLESIRYSDFSQVFTNKKLGSSFKDLNEAFNSVIAEFRKTRTEKEEQYRFLQTVIQHVGVGLISFNQEGKVEFINNAAKKIFKLTHLQNVETLNNISPGFGNNLLNSRGNEKKIVKIVDEDELIQLLVYSTEFKMRNQRYYLLSIQNIQSELEEKEMEAWQKLIRVLTHEIMNSVTPISSLAGTMHTMISKDSKYDESIHDMRTAIETIRKRSDGLIHFVDNYRSLTHMPKPAFQIFPVKELFERITKLMEKDFTEKNIILRISVEPSTLELAADPELIEQVLINLVVNAVYAVKDVNRPEIKLIAHLDERGRTLIKVIDNGAGLSEELHDKVFIPFYTTKKNGSGIGLSLSRQIMRSHGGSIRISSKPNKETVFTLKF